MSKSNQKHMLPKLTNDAGGTPRSFPMSRGLFLDSTIKTYYGPGQDPDAGFPGNYSPPADWPVAGSPLRVPQVAWLSVAVHDFFDRHIVPPRFTIGFWNAEILYPAFQTWVVGETYVGLSEGSFAYTVESAAMDGSVTTAFAFGHANSDGSYAYEYTPNPDGPTVFASHDGEVEIYLHTIPNPYIDHYASILEMFEEVKSTVEELRPNRTWVQIWIPWSESLFDNRNYFQGFDSDEAVWWHMICPQDDGTWFGTDFLHIFAGSACSTFSGPERPYTNNTDILEIDLYEASYNFLKDVVARDHDAPDRFRDFAIRTYGLKVDIEDFPPYHPTTPSLGGHPSFSVSRTYYTGPIFFGVRHDDTIEVPWSTYGDSSTWPDQVTAIEIAENTHLNEQNTAHATRDDASRDFLRRSCEHMEASGIDARYLGDTQDMTAAALIAVIAAHFKFDSSTGDDLDSDE